MRTKNNHTELTLKEREIIKEVYRFRSIDRKQIQEMLNHKYHGQINIWLKNLAAKKYLKRRWENKLGENYKPAIYTLGPAGVNFITNVLGIDNKYLKKYYKEDRVSNITIDHCLACTNFSLHLKRLANAGNFNLTYYTETDLVNDESQKFLHCDGYFTLQNKKEKIQCFIEVDLETENRTTFKRKVAQYLRNWQSNKWKKNFKEFPLVCIICLTEERLEKLLLDTEEEIKTNNYPKVIFQFTTFDKITQVGINSKIWRVTFDDELRKLI